MNEIQKRAMTMDEVRAMARENIDLICAELERLQSIVSKIAWHRDGKGPDVPVLQERYDALQAEVERLRGALQAIIEKGDKSMLGKPFADIARAALGAGEGER